MTKTERIRLQTETLDWFGRELNNSVVNKLAAGQTFTYPMVQRVLRNLKYELAREISS